MTTATMAINTKKGRQRMKISIFSRHLQYLPASRIAEQAKKLGFESVDVTVRPGGHVEPSSASKVLPQLVKSIRDAGLDVSMITTPILDAESSNVEEILNAAALSDIKYYRWGPFPEPYATTTGVFQQLDEMKKRVERLAKLNERYGVTAIYHTASGGDRVGVGVWDLLYLLGDLDPDSVAINYDVGHATVEGGLSGWRNSFLATGPYLKGVALKDFNWQKIENRWRVNWCPVGEGMVNFKEFFDLLQQRDFHGPIQLHYEYPLGGADTGKKELSMPEAEVSQKMRDDLKLIHEAIRS